ncbi:tripartite tricarboxylate transporter TctB family protein [Polynucleobacter difficilis]|uniref:tripartite tricarboxylate transporter TctB family protein n=1 Tax=Polynucleobacter difficilis TaxID=556054 RepID=UPI000D3CCF80|nr:tripartite tricarboxylate transporter TctB family protein [Polynucleobacter difficilis]
MKIRNQRDFGAGIMFIVVGIFFAVIASQYRMGTAAKMGPGYFPFWLGVLMAVIGLIVLLSSLSKKSIEEKMPKWDFKIVLWITGSVVLYGLLLPTMGFIVAIFALVFVSASVSHDFGWKGTALNAVFLVGFTYLAFVKGLGLSFPLFPAFMN